MQEEVTQKTIAISVQTAKLSASVLQKAIKKLLAAGKNKLAEPHTGKQTLRQLRKHHAALSNVEITEQNIKAFSSVAKKYHMDFALKKDATTQPPHFIVFFKGNDKDTMEQAFKEFAAKNLNLDKKPSVRKLLSQMKEKAKQKSLNREKVKTKERGPEL